ncbi:MAG TPA: alpha-L-fucosidase [Flavitalea sp.]|nr:alpha-L-fucosidase [Flavitalea sp.]
MRKILLGIVIWISLGCLSSNAQKSTNVTVKPNTITFLYGTKASGLEGKVVKKNGDFMRFDGVSKLEWRIDVPSAGLYAVKISYGSKKAGKDDRIEISSGKKMIKYSVRPTAGVWGEGSFERIVLDETLSLEKGAQVLSIVVPGNDQVFDFRNLELMPVAAKSVIQTDEKSAHDSRAKSDWLAKAGYGLMFHWTSQSINQDGTIKAFDQAVEDFDLNAFVKMVEETGAGYVLFTIGHAEPYCPAPIKSWERYHPAHTAKRDLVMEMADKLNAKGIKLMCYFPTHVIGKYRKVGEREFSQINRDIMTEFGQRYGDKVAGYWFDGWYQCFEEYPGFSFKDFFTACKAGYSGRIISLNSWIYPAVTEWQEYWAGEAASPVNTPVNGTVERGPGKGLRYQALIIMEPYWVQQKTEMPDPRFNDEELSDYIEKCNAEGGAVTINLGIYQNGKIGDKALQTMKKVKARLRH